MSCIEAGLFKKRSDHSNNPGIPLRTALSPSVPVKPHSPKTSASLRSPISSALSSGSPALTTASATQILMPSASATATGQPIGLTPPTSSSSPGAGAATSGPGGPGGHPPGQPCCESGRPVLTDPITGQTVCSCQYDAHLLNYQRLAASTGLPLGMYNPAAAAAAYGAAAAATEQGFLPGLAPEQLQSAFYSPTGNGFDLKENLEAWRNLPYAAAASMYYPYDGGALSGYPFANGYGMDLNGARRKNATRETTSTLKAWLNEHRKNPYPTKGEKIMLAIITKMTLTQVSTWFANARRRLKKENKMTWSPRNRCDDDDAVDGDGKDDRTGNDSPGNGDRDEGGPRRDEDSSDIVDIEEDSNLGEGGENPKRGRPPGSPASSDAGSLSDSDVSQSAKSRSSPSTLTQKSHSHLIHLHHHTLPSSKPRIWSIVDTATSTSSGASPLSSPSAGTPLPSNSKPPTSAPGPGLGVSPSAAAIAANRAARLDYLTSPYPKGPGAASWYSPGNFNVASSAAAAAAFSPLYSCSPSAAMLGHLAAGGPGAPTGPSGVPVSSHLAAAAAAESSLSRLRSAAAAAGAALGMGGTSSADTIAAINKTITSIGSERTASGAGVNESLSVAVSSQSRS